MLNINDSKHDATDVEFLGQQVCDFIRSKYPQKEGGLKTKAKKVRRIADPHIRAKKINGKLYYYYRPGAKREIFLGGADYLLSLVLKDKAKAKL